MNRLELEENAMQVPRGLEALPGDGNSVGARVAPPLLVVMWLGAILLIGLGILILAMSPGAAQAGSAVPLWAPLLLMAFGVLVAVLALLSGRGHKFVIDDDGVHSNAVFGKANVRWDAIQQITLAPPYGNAIWFTAPGGIVRRGKVTRLKRISFWVRGLRVRSRELYAYIVERSKSRSAD